MLIFLLFLSLYNGVTFGIFGASAVDGWAFIGPVEEPELTSCLESPPKPVK